MAHLVLDRLAGDSPDCLPEPGAAFVLLVLPNEPLQVWPSDEALNDPEGLAPSNNSDLNCLTCIVYAEGGGLSAPCQYGIASAVLNRVGAARSKGKRTSICSIVSARGQFNGYNNPNYKGCMKCSVAPNRQPDLDQTVANFRVPFPVSDDIYFFGTNTRAIRNYFGKRLGLKPVDVPNCPQLAFYGQAGEE